MSEKVYTTLAGKPMVCVPVDDVQQQPVAWLREDRVLGLRESWSATCYGYLWAKQHLQDGGFVPLYLHPAPADALVEALEEAVSELGDAPYSDESHATWLRLKAALAAAKGEKP